MSFDTMVDDTRRKTDDGQSNDEINMLIRLCECACWSVTLLIACNKIRFSCVEAILKCITCDASIYKMDNPDCILPEGRVHVYTKG